MAAAAHRRPEQALRSGDFPLIDEERRIITSTSREDCEQMMQRLSERTSPMICTFWSLVWRVRPCMWASVA